MIAGDDCYDCTRYFARATKAEAEVERLRIQLKRIAEPGAKDGWVNPRHIAQDALRTTEAMAVEGEKKVR